MVSVAQLRDAGLGRGAVRHRVLNGRLVPRHRGVYAVGHVEPTFRARLWAAVLACGGPQAAVVSHRSAAAMWDLVPPPAGPIDVTTRAGCRSQDGIRVHRGRITDVVDDHEGLSLSSVSRTLVDLAAELTADRLERVVRRAEMLRLLDATAIAQQLGRRRGARKLRPAVVMEPAATRSELEDRFLAILLDARLPHPLVNAQVGPYEVDFLWPQARVVAETDGAAAHLTPSAFERDRARDAALILEGFRVVRFTWRQVTQEPACVEKTLRALLRGSSSG